MSGKRSQRSPILAIDLGAHSLKALSLKRNGQGQSLEGCVLPLDAGQPQSAVQAIREALGRLDIAPNPRLPVASSIGGAECVAQVC